MVDCVSISFRRTAVRRAESRAGRIDTTGEDGDGGRGPSVRRITTNKSTRGRKENPRFGGSRSVSAQRGVQRIRRLSG
jgi:hypothetical protein